MKNRSTFKVGFAHIVATFVATLALVVGISVPASGNTGIGYGGGSGNQGGGSSWHVATGWSAFLAGARISEAYAISRIPQLRSDGPNLLWQCQNSQVIWYLKFNPLNQWSGRDPAYYVGGFTPDYPAGQMQSPGPAYNDITIAARLAVARIGNPQTSTVIVCSRDLPSVENQWKTQTHSSTRTNSFSNTFFGPANLNTQVTRQVLQGSTQDPVGPANLQDQPLVSAQTAFGAYLQGLSTGALGSQAAYDAINNTLMGAPYNAIREADDPLNPNALTYRVNSSADRPDVTLSDQNVQGLAEGGVLNISQFDDYGYVTTTRDDTFRYQFTWRCTAASGRTWPGINPDGTLTDGGAVQIVANEAAASSAISGGFNGWACYVSAGTKPTNFNEASTANGWTLDNQRFNVIKPPTSQLSSAFYQIMTVHCNLEEYQALTAALGVEGVDYWVLEQSIGRDNSVTAMIRTRVYTSGAVTTPDNPSGKRAQADQLLANWQAAQAIADAQVALATSRETAANNAELLADSMRPENNPNLTTAENALASATSVFEAAVTTSANDINALRAAAVSFRNAVGVISTSCVPNATATTRDTFNTIYGSSSAGFIQAFNSFEAALVVDGSTPPSFDKDAIDAAVAAFQPWFNSMVTAADLALLECPGAAGGWTAVNTTSAQSTVPLSSQTPMSPTVLIPGDRLAFVSPSGVLVQDRTTGAITTLNASVTSATPVDMVYHADTNSLYISGAVNSVRRVNVTTGVFTSLSISALTDSFALSGNFLYLANPNGASPQMVRIDLALNSVSSPAMPLGTWKSGPGAFTFAAGDFYGVRSGNQIVRWSQTNPTPTVIATASGTISWISTLDNQILVTLTNGSHELYSTSGTREVRQTVAGASPFITHVAGNRVFTTSRPTSGTSGGTIYEFTATPATQVGTDYASAKAGYQTAQSGYTTRIAAYTTALNGAVVATCNLDTINALGTVAIYPACNTSNTSVPGTMAARSTPAQNCSPNDSYTCRTALALATRDDATTQREEADRLVAVAEALRLEYVAADAAATAAESSTWGYQPADPVLRGGYRDLGDVNHPNPAQARTGYTGFYDKECTVDCISIPTAIDNSALQNALNAAIAAENAALAALNAANANAASAQALVSSRQTALNNATTAYHTARSNAVNAANSLRNYINEVPAGSGGNTYRSLPSNGNTSSAEAGALVTALDTYSAYYASPTTVRPNPATTQSTDAVTRATRFIDGTADSINGDTSLLVSNPSTNQGAGSTAQNCSQNSKIRVCVSLQQTGEINVATNQSVVRVIATIQSIGGTWSCNSGGSTSGSGVRSISGGIAGLDRAADDKCSSDPAFITHVDSTHWVTHNASRAGTVSQSFNFTLGSESASGQFGSVTASTSLALRTLPPAGISVQDALGATGVARTNSFINTNNAFATAYSDYVTAQNSLASAVTANASALTAVTNAQNAYNLAQIATQDARDALDRAPQAATGDTVTGLNATYPGNRAAFNATPQGNLNYKDELGGVLLNKDTASEVVNSNYLEVFRDNSTQRLTLNVTFPDTQSKLTSTGEASLLYRGQAPVTTTVVLWNMSTPNTTPQASQFIINAADSAGVSRAQLLTGNTNPATVAQRNFTRPGALDTYNGLLATSVPGFYNDFNISGTWSSTRTRPIVLNVKWEFQPVNRVTVPTLVGFTSNLQVEPNTQPVQVEQPIDVRCYAAFGGHRALTAGTPTTLPNINAAGDVISQSGTLADVMSDYTGTDSQNLLDTQLLQGPRTELNAAVRAANPGSNFTYEFPRDTNPTEIAAGIADPDTLRAASDGDIAYRQATNLVIKFIRSVAN